MNTMYTFYFLYDCMNKKTNQNKFAWFQTLHHARVPRSGDRVDLGGGGGGGGGGSET